jgi:SAM-dependent methyltransferase
MAWRPFDTPGRLSDAERTDPLYRCCGMGVAYVAANIAKNALAPVAIPLWRGRGSLGMDGDPDAVLDTLNKMAPALQGFDAATAKVLELGPGRTPDVLAAFLAAGADSALGLDLTVQAPPDAHDPARYAFLPRLLRERGQPFLDATGAEAREVEHPPRFDSFSGDRIPLPDASVDLVFSKSVLEHVAPAKAEPLLREMYRVLRPGGRAVHWVDLRDHMHINGDDAVTGDWLDALRYPEPLFRAMFSNRSTAINRLRAPQWRSLLERTGFRVAGWWEQRFPMPAGFDPSRLRPPWNALDEQTLSVGAVQFSALR